MATPGALPLEFKSKWGSVNTRDTAMNAKVCRIFWPSRLLGRDVMANGGLMVGWNAVGFSVVIADVIPNTSLYKLDLAVDHVVKLHKTLRKDASAPTEPLMVLGELIGSDDSVGDVRDVMVMIL